MALHHRCKSCPEDVEIAVSIGIPGSVMIKFPGSFYYPIKVCPFCGYKFYDRHFCEFMNKNMKVEKRAGFWMIGENIINFCPTCGDPLKTNVLGTGDVDDNS